MNNPDHISESFKTIFWVKILQFFDADPGFGMEKILIRDGKNLDLGWKKFGSGIRDGKIRIRDGKFFFAFFGLKYLNSLRIRDPGSGIREGDISDPGPGWKKFGSGILEKHHGSATLAISEPQTTKCCQYSAHKAPNIGTDTYHTMSKLPVVSSHLLVFSVGEIGKVKFTQNRVSAYLVYFSV